MFLAVLNCSVCFFVFGCFVLLKSNQFCNVQLGCSALFQIVVGGFKILNVFCRYGFFKIVLSLANVPCS